MNETAPVSQLLPDHGTDARYQRKCRCDDCRAAHRNMMARWRRKNGHYDSKGRNRATAEAARRYAAEHPDEWRELVQAEVDRAYEECALAAASDGSTDERN